MSIAIRQTKLNNNWSSLYLHIYFPNQKPYEGLKLKIYTKPRSRFEKETNRLVMEKAEEMKALRMRQFQTNSFEDPSLKYKNSFLVFFKSLIRERQQTPSYENWISSYKQLCNFCEGKDLLFSECNDHFLRCFRTYLLTGDVCRGKEKLRNNTASIYYSKIVTALNEAHNQNILLDNPSKRVKLIPLQETTRVFLTLEEVQKLTITKCQIPVLKTAFIFGCLTGLRISDIMMLKWGNIEYSLEEQIWKLNIRQKKTKNLLYLPIKEQAVNLLGVRGDDNELVFNGLTNNAYVYSVLANWVKKDAGINKHVTFHTSRHTFGTLAITMGVELYSLMDLLGHKNIATTQVYAKIVNLKRNKTIALLPDFGLN